MDDLIGEALRHTTDTKACEIGFGAVRGAAAMFRSLFPGMKAVVVADENTWRVAGQNVQAVLEASESGAERPFVFTDPELFAEWKYVIELENALKAVNAIPVAVGSGVINDLCKLVAHRLGRCYMVVGTAASMDGYTASNASITKDGMKQTMNCRAPLGCIVDSGIAARAPKEMVASGYADLIAKIPAGADWILADAVGSEAIDGFAWDIVQGPLRDSLANPEKCASGDVGETEKLCSGLVMSGFAMQAMNSSRPASGTEHQVSHYLDMEGLCHNGKHVSHGFKVGLGTLISTKTLEFLLRQDLSRLDADAVVARWWPDFESVKAAFPSIYGSRVAHIRRAEVEYAKKFPSTESLRRELCAVRDRWPELSRRIREQLMPFEEVREKLVAVGAPVEPEDIGISRERFRETYRGVPYMRARYFGLDLVERIGLMPRLLDELFGKGGVWECGEGRHA